MSGTERLRNRINGRVLPSSNGKAKKPGKASGRFEKINWFVDVKMAELPNAERSVWIVLWKEERGGVASVSHQQLADRCGISRRSAIRAVNSLIGMRLVKRVEKGSPTQNSSNKYLLGGPT